MQSSERDLVEEEYLALIGGPKPAIRAQEGVWLTKGDGIYELQEKFDRKHKYSEKPSDESLEKVELPSGLFVEIPRPKTREYDYIPLPNFPSDSLLVVRTAALREMEKRLQTAPLDRPLEKRERTTLLIMIAALAKLAHIDFSETLRCSRGNIQCHCTIRSACSDTHNKDPPKAYPGSCRRSHHLIIISAIAFHSSVIAAQHHWKPVIHVAS